MEITIIRPGVESIKSGYNFSFNEFWYLVNRQYNLYTPLIDGVQAIRDFYNIPFEVTSTFRRHDTFGFHKTEPCSALDCVPVADEKKIAIIADFKKECLNYIGSKGSDLIEKLRTLGITGFGIENVCIHIDCRPSGSRRDSLGTFTVFEFKMVNGKIVTNKAL